MSTTDRRRRRLLYLIGLVPALLLLMVSGRIVVLLHQQGQAMAAYGAGDYERAAEHFANNRWLNPIERWVAPFGEGDAHYRLEDFPKAIAAFEAALEVVPEVHECTVRVNLALAHEALGDSLEADDKVKAVEAWQAGREVVRPCKKRALLDDPTLEELPRDAKERERELRDRLRKMDPEERAELDREEQAEVAAVEVDARLARKLGVDDPVETKKPDEPPPEDEDTREKRRRLEDRNKKALEDNVKHKDEFDTDPPTPTPDPSPTPQW